MIRLVQHVGCPQPNSASPGDSDKGHMFAVNPVAMTDRPQVAYRLTYRIRPISAQISLAFNVAHTIDMSVRSQ